jgi:hypothetical protein
MAKKEKPETKKAKRDKSQTVKGKAKSPRAPEKRDERKKLETIREIEREKQLSLQEVGSVVCPLRKKSFAELLERGPLDAERRGRSLESFRLFAETYGAEAFRLNWSPYHLDAIQKIEDAVNSGAMFAFAMPRGSGKSTICHWAMIWASLSGRVPYVLYVGATSKSAERRLQNLKRTLRFNELLFDDFPEVVAPIRHCAGEPRRAAGQKYQGAATGLEWTDRIVLGAIPGLSQNFVIDTGSIDGELRGRSYENQKGETVRPGFVVVDDPQTRESAKSRPQTDYREAILKGDLRYLAGPGTRTGLVVPCTVIYQDDLADRLLDTRRNPEFKGSRSKMLDSFPERVDLWEQYDEIRKQSFRDGGNGEEATEFYRVNRDEMDRGAVAAWAERFGEGELSAIQSAMNLKLADEASFFAECQNEPLISGDDEDRQVLPADVEGRSLGVPWGTVPDDAEKITGFIDISEKVLWFALVAWRKDGTGTIFRYGAFPDQGADYVKLSAVRRSLQAQAGKGKSFLAALLEGLEELVELLAGAEFKSETGDLFTLSGLGIDSGWGEYATDVYRFCRRSSYRSILRPTKGIGITALRRPLVDPEKKIKSRESVEGQWLFSPTKLGIPLLQYDTNLWKTRVSSALRLDIHAGGSLSFTRPRLARGNHRMIAEQLTAEIGERVSANGRTVTQWRQIPGRDNHLLDCAVGAAVVANTIGIRFDLGFSTRRIRQVDGDKKAGGRSASEGGRAEKSKAPRARSRPRSSVTF